MGMNIDGAPYVADRPRVADDAGAIADTRLADILASAPVPVDVIADAADASFAPAAREFRLPENVAQWHGGADMQAIFFTKTLAAIVDELAGIVPEPRAS